MGTVLHGTIWETGLAALLTVAFPPCPRMTRIPAKTLLMYTMPNSPQHGLGRLITLLINMPLLTSSCLPPCRQPPEFNLLQLTPPRTSTGGRTPTTQNGPKSAPCSVIFQSNLVVISMTLSPRVNMIVVRAILLFRFPANCGSLSSSYFTSNPVITAGDFALYALRLLRRAPGFFGSNLL